MKNHIILGMCCIVILSFILGCNNYTQFSKEEFDGMAFENMILAKEDAQIHRPIDGEVNFELLGSYEVNARGILREFLGISDDENMPFTFFHQTRNLERLQAFADANDFELPDFGIDFDNYPNHYLAITIGRKLVGLRLIAEWHGNFFAEFIFAEEYQDNTLHFYITDNILIYTPFMGEHAFYIMRGEEKIYYGSLIEFIMRVP